MKGNLKVIQPFQNSNLKIKSILFQFKIKLYTPFEFSIKKTLKAPFPKKRSIYNLNNFKTNHLRYISKDTKTIY